MSTVQIVGRSSSHFTRVTRFVAHELGVPFEFVPILDITQLDASAFGENPALKMPTLHRAGSTVFGTENICRALAELSDGTVSIVWPEALKSDLSRNAQELVWHGMAAQVQLSMGTLVAKLPADNVYFRKARVGFEGALGWLDRNLAAALSALPPERNVSLFEVSLFCLIEHLPFRGTLPVDGYPALVEFARAFGKRPSAERTPYAFDKPPAA